MIFDWARADLTGGFDWARADLTGGFDWVRSYLTGGFDWAGFASVRSEGRLGDNVNRLMVWVGLCCRKRIRKMIDCLNMQD